MMPEGPKASWLGARGGPPAMLMKLSWPLLLKWSSLVLLLWIDKKLVSRLVAEEAGTGPKGPKAERPRGLSDPVVSLVSGVPERGDKMGLEADLFDGAIVVEDKPKAEGANLNSESESRSEFGSSIALTVTKKKMASAKRIIEMSFGDIFSQLNVPKYY